MQQLTIEHKKSTSKYQKTEQKQVEGSEINVREGKGLNLALTKNVFYLGNSKNVYYVQSEHSNERYYFVKYMFGVNENEDWCSCPDSSIRKIKCKHIWSIEYSIRRNSLKEISHLPKDVIRYPQKITATKDWRSDEYDF